ncbi:methylated-DNA-[protein]-cysteine S-methyltransferase [Luteimonas cucumeris]|uniref:Methylated-DNA--protein-cysteine methyltransferase n=1 Tax=Luteimonas cucumeris TaxID=985012 RepID=A0A562KZW8_9GAMM|nr:methylated-DNA--[protein]-cysteine S-methyltransferase [Luteimonas cucumeris]TWI00969.1 methylated-DNA-[protein]-cysteine S-methyltransferase [Luteimonas cucumeris]
MWFDDFQTPIGKLVVAADAEGIRHILFDRNRYDVSGRGAWLRSPPRVAHARRQLEEYFAGERCGFELDLKPAGTPFQVLVWNTLATIPYGVTWSYGQLARCIGEPEAARAVGAANGRNPIPIVLPCHRVIGADGSLTGFGGGLPTKAALLRLEGALAVEEAKPVTGDLFG